MTEAVLMASAADIGGLRSLGPDGSPVDPDPAGLTPGDVRDSMNTITVSGGRVLEVLDPEPEDGIMCGSVYLESEDGYYGAMAVGLTSKAGAGNPSFYVRAGDAIVKASRIDDQQHDGQEITIWYLEGVYNVDEVIVIDPSQDGGDPSANATRTVEVPLYRLYPDSELRLTGNYIIAEPEDRLKRIGWDETNNSPKVPGNPGEYNILVGVMSQWTVQGSNHLVDGRVLLEDDHTTASAPSGAGSVSVTFRSATDAGLQGYLGKLVLHLEEVDQGLAVNTFDVVVGVYVKAAQNVELTSTMLMRPCDRGFCGSSVVMLPFLDGSKIGRYTVSSAENAPNGLSMETVCNNLGKSGWVDGTDGTAAVAPNTLVGTGGVISPAIRFSLAADAIPSAGTTIQFQLEPEDGSSGSVTVTLTITYQEPREILIHFIDKGYEVNDGVMTSHPDDPTFTIRLEYGQVLDELRLLCSDTDPGDASRYAEVSPPDAGRSWWLYTGEPGAAATYGLEEPVPEERGRQVTLTAFLDEIHRAKEDVTLDVGGQQVRPYEHVEYADSPTNRSEFNFYLPIASLHPKSVYFNYGYTVTVVPAVLSDGRLTPLDQVRVEPASLYVDPARSEFMDLDALTLHVPAGFRLPDQRVWYQDSPGSDPPYRQMEHPERYLPLDDETVYIVLDPVDRVFLTVRFHDTDLTEFPEGRLTLTALAEAGCEWHPPQNGDNPYAVYTLVRQYDNSAVGMQAEYDGYACTSAQRGDDDQHYTMDAYQQTRGWTDRMRIQAVFVAEDFVPGAEAECAVPQGFALGSQTSVVCGPEGLGEMELSLSQSGDAVILTVVRYNGPVFAGTADLQAGCGVIVLVLVPDTTGACPH